MKRQRKLLLGWVTIILSYVAAGIGLWGYGQISDELSRTVRFVLSFFITFAPLMTTLTIITLLKWSNE
ncbi:MAG: hypothetical protein PHQ72_11895 [Hespellia sp.]|nr:hypothetical protein [Hespellia sp.]